MSLARERFVPEPIVVRLPEWRPASEDHGEFYDEMLGKWTRIHPIFVRALEALRDGAPFEEAYQRALPWKAPLEDKHVRKHLRRFYYALHVRGQIRIPFEEPPALYHGRYEHVKELGRGGVGVARLCRDLQTQRFVVVKHAWGWLQPIEDCDRSVRNEAETLRVFDHPGILRELDGFELDGLYHLVREYAEGTPMNKIRAWPAWNDARQIGAQLADAMAHMHERGWLCMDATPGNFTWSPGHAPQLIDIGLARAMREGRVTLPHRAGSRGYVAPEVLDEKIATPVSDVYALGSLLYAMRVGGAPSDRLTVEKREAKLREKGAEPGEIAMIARLCAEVPSERPATMREVRAMLLGAD